MCSLMDLMACLEFRLSLIQFQKLTREVGNAQSPYELPNAKDCI